MFFQKKKDRTIIAEFDGATYKKGDVLFAMRPLRDYTKLNSTMALRIPDFWREFCPTIEAIRSVFPSGCKFMAMHDCKNAHHSVKLSDESYKYCNSRYIDGNGNPRIIQALGADQGINAIALFFQSGFDLVITGLLVKLGLMDYGMLTLLKTHWCWTELKLSAN